MFLVATGCTLSQLAMSAHDASGEADGACADANAPAVRKITHGIAATLISRIGLPPYCSRGNLSCTAKHIQTKNKFK
jgi:hypothetical protein